MWKHREYNSHETLQVKIGWALNSYAIDWTPILLIENTWKITYNCHKIFLAYGNLSFMVWYA